MWILESTTMSSCVHIIYIIYSHILYCMFRANLLFTIGFKDHSLAGSALFIISWMFLCHAEEYFTYIIAHSFTLRAQYKGNHNNPQNAARLSHAHSERKTAQARLELVWGKKVLPLITKIKVKHADLLRAGILMSGCMDAALRAKLLRTTCTCSIKS